MSFSIDTNMKKYYIVTEKGKRILEADSIEAIKESLPNHGAFYLETVCTVTGKKTKERIWKNK
jgi:hypothetical protein